MSQDPKPDLGQEVEALRRELSALTRTTDERLGKVEKHLGLQTTPAPTVPPPPVTVPPVTPTVPPPVVPPVTPTVPKPTPSLPPQPTVPQEATIDWLIRKAPYFLSRLGIIALVIGLVYLLAYTWEYFGPIYKIGAGFLASLALVAVGEVFSRRKDWGWYGQAITGGGYALAYFVMYAAQNIASVKVIDDTLLSSCGLLGVAGLAMGHSIFRRSESMALLSTLLAFASISLSPVTGFSVVATGILMTGLSLVVVRQRWLTVHAVGCAASYLTYVLFTQPQVAVLGGSYGFALAAGFLGVLWLAWNAVSFRLFSLLRGGATTDSDIYKILPAEIGANKENLPFVVSLLNGGAFIAAANLAIANVFPQYFYLLMFVLSAAYFVNALVARGIAWKTNAQVSAFAALTLAAIGSALKLDPTATLVVWFFEVPILMTIGLRNKFTSFRLFAAGLTVVSLGWFAFGGGLTDGTVIFSALGIGLAKNVLVGGLAAAAMALTSYVFGRAVRVSDMGLGEADAGKAVYTALSLALVWLLTVVQAPHALTAVILAAEALALLLLSQRRGNSVVSFFGKGFLLTSLIATLATASSVGFLQIGLVLGITYGVAALYRTNRLRSLVSVSKGMPYSLVLVVAGSLVGLLLTYIKVSVLALPTVAALEMVALLVAGFLLRDSVLRILSNLAGALAVLGLFVAFGGWTWAAVLPAAFLFYGVHMALRYVNVAEGDVDRYIKEVFDVPAEALKADGVLVSVYSALGTVVLTVAFMALLSWQHLAVALALEGFALMAVAFVLRDRQFLMSGFAVFALLVIKLAVYDLRDAETVWRIISFVFAGVVMLLAGFVGARFNKVFAKDVPELPDPSTDGAGDQQ